MTTHKRGENIKVISVSIPKELLSLVDERAASLNMNRSQYLAQLVRGDIAEGGSLTVSPQPRPLSSESPQVTAAREKLLTLTRKRAGELHVEPSKRTPRP